MPTRATVLWVSVQLQAVPVTVRLPRRASRLSLLRKGEGLNPSDLEQIGPAGVRRCSKHDNAEERAEATHPAQGLGQASGGSERVLDSNWHSLQTGRNAGCWSGRGQSSATLASGGSSWEEEEEEADQRRVRGCARLYAFQSATPMPIIHVTGRRPLVRGMSARYTPKFKLVCLAQATSLHRCCSRMSI
jgi:hypothetical protein